MASLAGAWIRGLIFATLVTPIAFILIALNTEVGSLLALCLWFTAWILPWFFLDHVYGGHWELSVEDQGHLVEPAYALTAQRLLSKRPFTRSTSPCRVRSSR